MDRTHTADKAQALRAVTDGARGCRKVGAYMFCVGPDGVMSTRSNPVLRGRDPHDRTGNHSVRTMMDAAGPGRISVIRSLFPTLGSTVEEPKTTYCTCTGDQTCGVGAYGTDIVAPAIASPDGWIALLRQRLDAKIPRGAHADWIAFLDARNAQGDEKALAIARACRDLKFTATALGQVEAG